MFVLVYQKRNDHEIFYSNFQLISSDSNTNKSIKVMHKRIMTEIKKSAGEDWAVIFS